MLKSVKFFIFIFQKLNIAAFRHRPFNGVLREKGIKTAQFCQMFTSVYIVWSGWQIGLPLPMQTRAHGIIIVHDALNEKAAAMRIFQPTKTKFYEFYSQ